MRFSLTQSLSAIVLLGAMVFGSAAMAQLADQTMHNAPVREMNRRMHAPPNRKELRNERMGTARASSGPGHRRAPLILAKADASSKVFC